ncbi:hypothetical protein CAEBREN_24457 [Caenorhabditis brenneri]|uniref:Uncharacterized protein n=1 Tax=Caenorhabditis brenneri TaxID=135651 RepID=G0MFR9_CAEBE|nr:hypothetical protein CAEBREN_24457 [Caenorhabditis brenneri]
MELIDPDGRHITDYEEWHEKDRLAAELAVYGKPMLRPKAHSFITTSPSSMPIRSGRRPIRPSSTPDNSMISESERQELKRDTKQRSSWKSFFELKPLVKKFGSSSKS